MIGRTFKPDKQKNDARKILSSIFNFGIKRKWCHENPAMVFDIIAIQEHEIHPLTPEELQDCSMLVVLLQQGKKECPGQAAKR